MSIEMVASFDALRALRLLFKLEESPDADSAYLRNILVADTKRHIAALTTAVVSEVAPVEDEAAETAEELPADAVTIEAVSEEALADDEAVDADLEEAAVEDEAVDADSEEAAVEDEATEADSEEAPVKAATVDADTEEAVVEDEVVDADSEEAVVEDEATEADSEEPVKAAAKETPPKKALSKSKAG